MGTRAQSWASGRSPGHRVPPPEPGRQPGASPSVARGGFPTEGDGKVTSEAEHWGDQRKCGVLSRG